MITRSSKDNSLTRPWTRSLKDYMKGPDPSGAAEMCGCGKSIDNWYIVKVLEDLRYMHDFFSGWPHHLYIPRGNTKGMAFDIFVIVTNFDEDIVTDSPADLAIPEGCNGQYIYCGRARRKYPDPRPMGYPFDRPPYRVPETQCGYGNKINMKDILCRLTGKIFTRPVATLEEYVHGAPNMAMTVVGSFTFSKVK